MNMIFLGPPGAGKGTLAQILVEKTDLTHLSTGDMLREEIKKGSDLGKMAKSFIDEGKLVPDNVIIGMVEARLKSTKGGIIFDGFPRTVEQAEALDTIAKIDLVIDLYTTVDVIISRICGRRICKKCGAVYNTSWYKKDTCQKCQGELYTRADDNEETVKKRFDVYTKQTAPLVAYYEKKGVLRHIDASGDIDEKIAAIMEIMESAHA